MAPAPQSQGDATDPFYFLRHHETNVVVRDKCMKFVYEGLLLIANDDESRTAAAKLARDIELGEFPLFIFIFFLFLSFFSLRIIL